MSELDVLLVDDEEELVSALVERLGLRGIRAEGVKNSARALETLAARGVRVVVADVRMPGIGGIELARRIRELHPETAVVLLTGHGSEEDAADGIRAGAVAYLAKPVRIDELVRVIRGAGGGPA